jgi:hypothetical protein
MDNPEILVTLDTQDEDEQNKRTQHKKLKRWAIARNDGYFAHLHIYDGDAGRSAIFIWSIETISFIIACVTFSELENDTLNQAELNEIKIN